MSQICDTAATIGPLACQTMRAPTSTNGRIAMKRIARTLVLSLLVVSTAALTACSVGTESPPDASGSAGQSVAQTKDDDGAAPITPNASSRPTKEIATQTFDAPVAGSTAQGGTMTAAIRAIEVSGDTMTLRWAFRWDNDEVASDTVAHLSDFAAGHAFSSSLTDLRNLKQYRPLCTEGSWTGGTTDEIQCGYSVLVSPSLNTGKLTNHATVEAWAVFPAPKEKVDALDVLLTDGWPVYTSVPVTYLDR